MKEEEPHEKAENAIARLLGRDLDDRERAEVFATLVRDESARDLLVKALTALDAVVKVKGPQKERIVPVKKFYRPLGNVLRANEMLAEIQIPRFPSPAAMHSFLKFRSRKSIDFAVVSVAAIIAAEGGICRDVRIALGAVAPTPLRAAKAEELLKGKAVDAAAAEAAAEAAVASAAPLTMNAYKVEIAKSLVKRALLT